jgi:hypothetical protein
MIEERSVNPCQPGFGASCSLCCGSHNNTLNKDELEKIYSERSADLSAFKPAHPEDAPYEKLFDQEMQCANFGELPGEPGILGCLVYHTEELTGDAASFFHGTCKVFTCPACQNLDDRQILFAAELMQDWYYYGLFLNDLVRLEEFHAEYGSAENVPEDVLEELKEELYEHFIEEDGK